MLEVGAVPYCVGGGLKSEIGRRSFYHRNASICLHIIASRNSSCSVSAITLAGLTPYTRIAGPALHLGLHLWLLVMPKFHKESSPRWLKLLINKALNLWGLPKWYRHSRVQAIDTDYPFWSSDPYHSSIEFSLHNFNINTLITKKFLSP